MAKKRLTTYTFDASAQTIVQADFSDITLAGIQLIVNVTDNIIIYNFADATKGGTLSTDTLTLDYDTSSMDDTDELMILVEDGTTTQTVSGTVTANAGTNLNTSALALETGGNLAAIATDAAAIEVLLTTIESNQLPDGHNVTVDNASLAVTNADLSTIAGDTTSIDGKIPALGQALAAASVPVVLTADQISTLTPPAAISGFATSAKQDTLDNSINTLLKPASTLAAVTTVGTITNVVHIDDNAGSITVDGTVAVTNADLGTIAGDTTSIDGKITACNTGAVVLAAGTAAFGKLAANSGVDIGDVDVLSLPALAAGTNAIGKLLPPDIDVTAHTNYVRKYYTSAGAATDGIIWSPAAGKRWHVVTMYIQTSAAATITLEDDKAGGDDPVWKGELAANSGVTLSFSEKYPMASGEDAADLTITTSAGNCYVTVVGYEC